MPAYTIVNGKVLDVLSTIPDNCMDGALLDPPYGLGSKQPTAAEIRTYLLGGEMDTGGDFMGKDWNVPSVATWCAMFRVLKPGAAVLCFGGPRVFDLVTIGMRMAGFEVRDSLCWLYAKGFPKSMNVSKALDAANGSVRPVIGVDHTINVYKDGKNHKFYSADEGNPAYGPAERTGPGSPEAEEWDGYGTALKPGWEPIILARKPLEGTVVENVRKWGVGAIDIDGCRIGDRERTDYGLATAKRSHGSTYGAPSESADFDATKGRWPGNVALDEGAGLILDEVAGARKSGVAVRENGGGGQIFSGIGEQPYKPKPKLANLGYMDGKTNASRFFFSSKVNTKEREAGCGSLPVKSAGEMTGREDGTDGLNSPRAGAGRSGGAHNHHPTLKPLALNKWLATMIRPPKPDAVLLVPYAGAGSEVIGALQAGWPMVMGIEMEADYVAIAKARVAHWLPEVEEA